MRLLTIVAAALLLNVLLPAAAPQNQGFLGRWNLTGTGQDSDRVYWLEVTGTGGKLSGIFLNRGGSPVPLAAIAVNGGELVFQLAPGKATQPAGHSSAKLDGESWWARPRPASSTVDFIGVRPPKWPASNANGTHKYGTPVELFAGTTADAFDYQAGTYPITWKVEDGVLTNEPPTRNLVSKQKFWNFRLQAEYKLADKSNSGIYLRGRYEMQVLADYGQPAEKHGHMSLYAWAPPLVNASKPAGEWQSVDIVIVGNRVTATLNGKKVQDNTEIQAITGGALDANGPSPGRSSFRATTPRCGSRKLPSPRFCKEC